MGYFSVLKIHLKILDLPNIPSMTPCDQELRTSWLLSRDTVMILTYSGVPLVSLSCHWQPLSLSLPELDLALQLETSIVCTHEIVTLGNCYFSQNVLWASVEMSDDKIRLFTLFSVYLFFFFLFSLYFHLCFVLFYLIVILYESFMVVTKYGL